MIEVELYDQSLTYDLVFYSCSSVVYTPNSAPAMFCSTSGPHACCPALHANLYVRVL